MTQHEKDQLIARLGERGAWCQKVEAKDPSGRPVRYSDEHASAWDIVGAMCSLFGWDRACQLFPHVARFLTGWRRDAWRGPSEMLAMGAIQDYNDAPGTTYEKVFQQLQGLPVWHRAAGTEETTM